MCSLVSIYISCDCFRSTGFCLCVAQKPVLLKQSHDILQQFGTRVWHEVGCLVIIIRCLAICNLMGGHNTKSRFPSEGRYLNDVCKMFGFFLVTVHTTSLPFVVCFWDPPPPAPVQTSFKYRPQHSPPFSITYAVHESRLGERASPRSE